jgi:hypothetical protein
VERLLLVWDELDELMGYARHLTVGLSFSMHRHGLMLRRRLRGLGASQADTLPGDPA